MNLKVQIALQTALAALQGVIAGGAPLSPMVKLYIVLGISALQGILGVSGLFVNPDGTKASEPYQK